MSKCCHCEEEMTVFGYDPDGRREKCQTCGWEVYVVKEIPNCMQCGREMEYIKGLAYQCPRCQRRVKL
jgi:hypothetical protein